MIVAHRSRSWRRNYITAKKYPLTNPVGPAHSILVLGRPFDWKLHFRNVRDSLWRDLQVRLSRRSFPYPVVGNADDVLGTALQATLEMTSDGETVFIDCSIFSSDPTINGLISGNQASYFMHVECGNTMYRQAFELDAPVSKIAIPCDELH